MPFKTRGPLVGTIGGNLTITIASGAITIWAGTHKLDLDKAPKDANGMVESLNMRKDGKVWASGVPFFDSRTGTYFPARKPSAKPKRKRSAKAPVPKKRPPKMIDSIETVGKDAVVHIL